MFKWLDSQSEFSAMYAAMGLIAGAMINGWFNRKSKSVDASIALQGTLVKRIEDLDARVVGLESRHDSDQARIDVLTKELNRLRIDNAQLQTRMDCSTCPLLNEPAMLLKVKQGIAPEPA